MSVGVHQHIRTGVSCCFHIAAGDHQLVGGTGMPQTVEHDAGKLRVCVLPFQELFADEHRLHRQIVGEPQQHPAVAVSLRVEGFFSLQPFQPLLQFLPQGGSHKDGAAGGENVHHWFLCKPALGGKDRQLPRPSAHPSAAEQVLAGASRSPFSASAGTKV